MRDAATAFDTYQNVKFFGSLNGLRFLCIGAVLWHHSPMLPWVQDAPKIFDRGFLGVNFFFVLSGYLITTLLLREESRKGAFSLKGFYWRRALRIIPVYFFVVTLVALWFIGVQGQTEYLPKMPYYYLFLMNFLKGDLPLLQPTWSLAFEEQYYMIWPALLMLLPVLGSVRFWVLGILVALFVITSAGHFDWMGLEAIETEHGLWLFAPGPYSALLIGSLAGMILHNRTGFQWAWQIFGRAWTPLAAFVALGVVINEAPGKMTGWPEFWVHALMAVCLITIVIREDHILRPVMAARPIARIGEISYGLYLYHLIGLHFGFVFGTKLGFSGLPEAIVITIIYLIVAVAISEASFRTLERYFLSFKHKTPWRRVSAAGS